MQKTLDGIRLRVEVHETEEAWLKRRKDGVGASESPALIYGSGHPQYLRKTGQWEDDFQGNELTDFGHRSEDLNAKWFEDKTGLQTHDEGDYAMFWHESLPMYATVDRFVRGENGGLSAVCELKAAFGDLAYLVEKIKTEDLHHSKLERYYAQVQHQLACTDLKEGYLSIIYFTGYSCGHRWFKCKRDERFIRAIEKRVKEFWHCVETRTPPDWTAATAADMEAIRKSHMPTEGRAVEFNGEQEMTMFARLQALNEKRKSIQKEEKELQSKMIARMAEEGAERIICGDKQIDYSKKRFNIKEYRDEQ